MRRRFGSITFSTDIKIGKLPNGSIIRKSITAADQVSMFEVLQRRRFTGKCKSNVANSGNLADYRPHTWRIVAFTLKFYYYNARINKMSLMTVKEVAAFLDVQEVRVERLERESLLVSKDKDVDGNPLFDRDDVERYKQLAERLGGI
tara:strand:- start:88 stop:528 length:441 start_codon:yes stop_codon:yes gene_type:complete